jgi:hypothetical protein
VFREARENFCHLRRQLAFSENNLRHAGTQSAMMVDLGEANILEGQMPQASHRLVRRQFAFADLVEKFADGFSVHKARRGRHSARLRSRLASGNVSKAGTAPSAANW